MSGPLAGVRVLDLTRLFPGNYCTWLLSSMGADVVKVEDPGAGDYMRDFGEQVDGQGGYNHLVNRGKRSVVADLKTPEGVEILLRLVDSADVLVESFRPSVMERLGVGYDTLRARRPQLVYANISGFGPAGPYADRAGHDLNYLAFSGLLDRLGPAGGDPVVPPVAVSDLVGGGLNTAVAVLGMLVRARSAGVGGRVDTALAEGVALMPGNLMADLLSGVPQPGRGGGQYAGGSAAYNVYALADGHVTVGAVEPQFWARMCELLELPELAGARDDPAADGMIRERLTARFAGLTREQAARLFADADACVEVVQSYEEMLASEQAAAAGYLRRLDGVSMPLLAPPFLLDGARPPETVRAPHQGEHSAEILREAGYPADEIERLMSERIAAPRKAR
ncbi:MAG TPA: CaiB/BaiF CoA-transferase family protein [Dactylosporangium sp.]|nr:CaiB/BaiF CoA-transferase family protein [Dactylosporangium sp.]